MNVQRVIAAAVAVVIVMGAVPAFAAGTGDDPSPTKDKSTTLSRQVEADYQAWLLERQEPSTATVSIMTIIAPYKYFWTPSHAQEKSYYCGPATVQVIDDYWGTAATQSTIAKYLGTTTAGTDFSKVDDALRYFSGRNYVYRTCASTYDFYACVEYGLLQRGNPMAIDASIDASVWDNYVYSHAGHIIPLEAFDWRTNVVRLNDPYDESYWRAGGGSTFGHHTYPKSQVAAGVMSHFRHAVVY